MSQTLDRALPPQALRPGLLQPGEVFDMLTRYRTHRVRAEDVAAYLERPLDQVLHALSYMTSIGLLEARQEKGLWTYGLCCSLSEAC